MQATNQNTVGVVDYLNKSDGIFLYDMWDEEITPDTNVRPIYVEKGKATYYPQGSISLRKISKMSNKEILKEIQNQVKKEYDDRVAEAKKQVQDFQAYTGEQDTSEYYELKSNAESGQSLLDGDLKSLKHYRDTYRTEVKITGALAYDEQGNDLEYEWLYYPLDNRIKFSKYATATNIKVSKVDYVYLTDMRAPKSKVFFKASDIKGTLGMDKEGTKNVSVSDNDED